ncbi:type ISP restriction/modification enzyme [Actinoallomurus rhizosphaericola]|uniref:type ISP restriction/modification enzyme n=1 Tax=Actinoallomurus rhizosphaericola TaxID=2952536 RepID=UPI0020927145|nr:type ISP restriction/modification enzyme [Actinoallomurus rhizosphaericola]MCO5999828.1 N-6 DNA methylase [Actinoallomurus rhizosphaericola]
MPATFPPAPLLSLVEQAVSRFGAAAAAKLRGGGSPEDQLRAPLERLFEEVAGALGVSVTMVGEMSLATLGVRPDYAVDVAGARVGYIELKAPGRGVPSTWTPSRHDKAQWEKLRLLPNVLYSDGVQWALYRDGELFGQVARLEGDIRKAGAKLKPAGGEFARVLADFLLWNPEPPRSVRQLVRAVAGLCKLLRTEVAETIAREQRGEEATKVFTELTIDWRRLLFPGLTHEEFADAYAQTVTFGLLLARVDGIAFEGRSLGQIAAQLGKSHSLMGKALDVLTHETVEGRSIVVETLKRIIGVVDWNEISDGSADSYLHLYEQFLEVYDADLRRQSGSYYTPNEVVSFMVRFTEDILRSRFGRAGGYSADDVVVVDPAMGTGTYLLNIIDRVAHTVEDEEGPGAVPGQLKKLFGRLIGLERQTGPFAVAELRLNQALKTEHKAEIADQDQKLFVTDTLDSPFEDTHLDLGSMYEPIVRARREANRVKRETRVQVVIGNPPYRERAKGLGGWIENGAQNSGHGIPLRDFKALGRGRYEFNLANLYVYFWRWATWKVFDAHPDQPSGIVAFITTSGYTTGPGFAGMREYLRRTADEGWIIDLSPEGHQPEVNTRVFPGVQHPLCIGIFARYGDGSPDTPARIHHLSIAGHRTAKFARLGALALEDPTAWTDCATGWQDRLQPAGDAEWLSYPLLGDLMPWAVTGVNPNRTWVYAPHTDVLKRRWARLIDAPADARSALLKETRDRTISSNPRALPEESRPSRSLNEETARTPNLVRTAYRSFDRQPLIYDSRVLDYARPVLWQVSGGSQVYVNEQHAHPITRGPGLVFTALVPNVDHFKGSAGGRVLPLYRDRVGLAANLAPRLTRLLAERLDRTVTAADLLAYIAAVTAHSDYTAAFREELRTPGVRVPLTADAELWEESVRLGRRVLWLHTYGERFTDPADGRPPGPPRAASADRPKVQVAIPGTAEDMPDDISYDPDTATLHVGAGQIAPVRPEVWDYEVSGMRVIKKWFGYRKKNPAGRRSSPLDDIHLDTWPADYTTDLLQLLNVLTLCVELEPDQGQLLARVTAGPLVTVADLEAARVLPVSAAVRKPPAPEEPDQPGLL